MDKTLLVIDLDGTFVSVNTFHKWMKFVLVEEFKRLHVGSVFTIFKIAFLRLVKKISHKQMKFRILKLSEKCMNQTQINHFVDTLDSYVNQKILHHMQESSYETMLATAAPILYTQSIQQKYHFNHLIATPDTLKRDWKENIREEKKNNYLKILDDQNLHPNRVILYSDHHDDLPLMKISDFTYLVQPSEETILAVQNADILFESM